MTAIETEDDATMMDYEDDDFGTTIEDDIVVSVETDEPEPAAAPPISNVADQLYLDSRTKFDARMLQPIDDGLLDASKSTMEDPVDESGKPNAFVGGTVI